MREAAKRLDDQLIEEGIKAILENGVEGFSIRQIAETCNVSCATPFKHFRGKENYFAKMSERLDHQLLETMIQIENQYTNDSKTAHLEMCLAYIRHLIQYPFLINTSFWRIINEEKKIGIRDWKSFQKMIEQFRKYCHNCEIDAEKEEEAYFSFQTFAYGTAFVVVQELRGNDDTLESMIRSVQKKICMDLEK